MPDFRQLAIDLANKARALHERERNITLESVDIIGEMDRYNAAVYLLLDVPRLAERVALSENQFLKRRQASRVLQRFPQFRELVVSGETTITTLALLAPKVTPANVGLILGFIRGKTARQVESFLGRVGPGGVLLAHSSKNDQSELLDRAVKAAKGRGRKVTRRQIMEEALAMWLDEWNDDPAEEVSVSHSSTNEAAVLTDVPASSSSATGDTMPDRIPPSDSLTNGAVTPPFHSLTNGPDDVDGLPIDWWLALMAPAIMHAATG